MAGRRDQEKLLAQHPLAGEAVVERAGLDPGERDVELVAPQSGEDLGRAPLAHMDADAGVGGVEGRKQAGQVDRPGRQHRPERDGSLQQPAQCGEVGADRVRPRDDLARPLEHRRARLGQLDAGARAAQQREPELGLELPDRSRDRRLREMQLLGGEREGPGVDHLDESAQLAELHRRIVDTTRGKGVFAIAHRDCGGARPLIPSAG